MRIQEEAEDAEEAHAQMGDKLRRATAQYEQTVAVGFCFMHVVHTHTHTHTSVSYKYVFMNVSARLAVDKYFALRLFGF